MTEPYESEKLPAHREPPAAPRTDATGAPAQRDRLRALEATPAPDPALLPAYAGMSPSTTPAAT